MFARIILWEIKYSAGARNIQTGLLNIDANQPARQPLFRPHVIIITTTRHHYLCKNKRWVGLTPTNKQKLVLVTPIMRWFKRLFTTSFNWSANSGQTVCQIDLDNTSQPPNIRCDVLEWQERVSGNRSLIAKVHEISRIALANSGLFIIENPFNLEILHPMNSMHI